ncbi:MAG: hypothetical protein MPJ24_01935 [Pirellulaceae bacterium]|nr:hypothetical protein [Pirellulaceae bacterium]
MKYKLLLMILATLVYLPKGYAKEYLNESTVFFSEDRNTFARLNWSGKNDINERSALVASIYQYCEEGENYVKVQRSILPGTSLKGHYLDNKGRYFVSLGSGDDPWAVQIYNLITRERRSFALDFFLPREMITGTKDENGIERHFGKNFPEVRTKVQKYTTSICWTGNLKWDESNLCLYTNYGGHPIDDTGFNPPNVKIDIAKMEVTLLDDDPAQMAYESEYSPARADNYINTIIMRDLRGDQFDIIRSSNNCGFARIERPDWPRKKEGIATAYIYHYQDEIKEYVKIKTLKIPYTSLPFHYLLLGEMEYFLVIGDGDDPRAVSMYNLVTGKEKFFALKDFLPKEMIAGRWVQRDGVISPSYYGSEHPKVRTRYVLGMYARHRWTGNIHQSWKGKSTPNCVYSSGALRNYIPPKIEINLKKMTVTLLGYNEEESEK